MIVRIGLLLVAMSVSHQSNGYFPLIDMLEGEAVFSGEKVESVQQRERILREFNVDQSADEKLNRLTAVRASTVLYATSKAQNSPVSIAILLQHCEQGDLHGEELCLAIGTLVMSCNKTQAGANLESTLWNDIFPKLSNDEKSYFIRSFGFAFWARNKTRERRFVDLFSADATTAEVRESLVSSVGGALGFERLRLRKALRVFAAFQDCDECTPSLSSLMMGEVTTWTTMKRFEKRGKWLYYN